MRIGFVSFFLLISITSFSQKKVSKIFETTSKEINIYTAGLDNLVVQDSNSDFVEVYLIAESYDEQLIKVENTDKTVTIKFDFEGTETREVVFRKFITKRLQRANAVVKIPKNKMVYIFGDNVDIESKSIQNNLAIYIENGIIKLNNINADVTLKLYSGNVYASTKNTMVDVVSNIGKIKVSDVLQEGNYKKTPKNSKSKLEIATIKANIFIKED